MMRSLFPAVVILLLLLLEVLDCQKVTLYTDSNGKGESREVNVSECVASFDHGFDQSVSSVNSHGSCFHFYLEQGCKGPFLLVRPGSPSHNDFGSFPGFNDKVRSIAPCHSDQCHPDYLEVEGSKEEMEVEIFDHDDFKGARSTITLSPGKCSVLPQKLIQHLTSIRPQRPSCLELHSDWNCLGDSVKIPSRMGFLYNMGHWSFNDRAKSLSYCGINCPEQAMTSRTGTGVLKDTSDTPPAPSNYITLYSETNFNGPLTHIHLGDGDDDLHCVNVTGEWEGAARSMRTYGACLVIYELPNCSPVGKNTQVMNEVSNLEERGFDRRTRSLEKCRKGTFFPTKGQPSSSSTTTVTLIVLGVVGSVLLLVLVLGFFLVLRMRKNQDQLLALLTEKEIEEFIHGIENFSGNLKDIEEGNAVEYAYSVPYNTQYEINRENVTFDLKHPLGSGEYAIVYPGLLVSNRTPSSEKLSVAVKTVKPNAGGEYLRALLKEVKTMIYVNGNSPHPNVLNLVGCCTKDIRKELLVMTELCENGSLEKFLQKNKPAFVNIVAKGQLMDAQTAKNGNIYLSISTLSQVHFNTFHLIEWACQIAEGMEYLASKKVIHGDLATRNIFLCSNFQAKIGDFGLSRQLYEYTQYVKKQQAPLPWRWLAIECLTQMEFSMASDVWAYGITLWEIFSLGDKPYPGSVWGPEFLSALKDGQRPCKPNFATSDCYNLMLDCWRENPSDRISFPDLREKLSDMIQVTSNIRSQYESISN